MKFNTNACFGSLGVIDGTERFFDFHYEPANTPVWLAEHFRACADLICCHVLETGELGLVMLKEWFPGEEDQRDVLDLPWILRLKLDDRKKKILDAWVEKNTAGDC